MPSNGPSLPTHDIPNSTMSSMPITTDHHHHQTNSSVSSNIQLPNIPHTSRHPHPLRSHSAENIHNISNSTIKPARKTHKRSLSTRIDPSVLADLHHIRGPTFANGRDGGNDVFPYPPLPIPTYPTFCSPQAERLSNATTVSSQAYGKDYPSVSVRPPLRPTVSFGGESRMSYYSLDSLALEKQSKVVVVEEEFQEAQPQARTSSRRTYGNYAILCLLSFLGGMNFTSLSTALPSLAVEYNIGAVASFWAAISFILAAALVQPLAMRISQVLGSKDVLLFGLPLFAIGSIASGASSGIAGLIAGRIFSGCGYGTISVTSQLIVRQLAGARDYASIERAITAMYWFGVALGPVVGGIAVQTAGWRCAVWVNVPFSVLSMVALPLLLRLPLKNHVVWRNLLNIDYFGWLLLTAATTACMLAISWAGSMYAWTSWQALIPLLFGLIVLAFFTVYTQYRIEPILPLTIFRNLSALVSCIGSLTHGVIIAAIVYLMPVCFAVTHGLSPAAIGAALGAWTITLVVTDVAASVLVRHIGHRWIVWFGWGLTIAGTAVLVVSNERSATAFCTSLGLIAGLGLGLLYPSLSTAVQSAATTDDETIHAAPLHSLFHMIGQAVGLTVGSGIFLNQLENSKPLQISLPGEAHKYVSDAVGLIEAIRSSSVADLGLRQDLIIAWTSALEQVWVAMSIFAAVAFILAVWFTEDQVPPRKPQQKQEQVSLAV